MLVNDVPQFFDEDKLVFIKDQLLKTKFEYSWAYVIKDINAFIDYLEPWL